MKFSLPKFLLDFERGVAGRSKFDKDELKDIQITIYSLFAAVMIACWQYHKIYSSLSITEEITFFDRIIYSSVVSLCWIFLYWMIFITITKRSDFSEGWFPSINFNAILGILSSFILLIVISWSFEILLISTKWDIVWANRASIMMGPEFTKAMTQSYIPSENWRFWPIIYLSWILLGCAYGVSGTSIRSYALGFTLFSLIIIIFASNPFEANYNTDVVREKLYYATSLSILSFALIRFYKKNAEEYQINRLIKYLGLFAVSIFFFTLIILNPPEFISSLAAYVIEIAYIGEYLEPLLSPLLKEGVVPSQWGGLLINLIVASAGCVIGFVIGVVLAFCRRSPMPLLKLPGVAIIEIVRSGPLICWLYFAMYLLPDVTDPLFTNPEDFDNIVRMMFIFSLFGGCYIAEVIRGGLQAVDSGQKEAALALGLNPFQTKLHVELPNAIRTTLPSIVSVFIGLWKDTTLLFIIEIVDFFRIAKNLANTDRKFLGDFIEPVYLTAIVFWIFAFYISRISMTVEKNLGLVNEGGGDAA